MCVCVQELVNYYYSTFDSNRSGLQALYRDASLLTWMGEQVRRMENIHTREPVTTCSVLCYHDNGHFENENIRSSLLTTMTIASVLSVCICICVCVCVTSSIWVFRTS